MVPAGWAGSRNNNVTRQLSMATRKELIEAVGLRYRDASLSQRSAILDESLAVTGYHHKHAIRLLCSPHRYRRSAATGRGTG